jgi:DNA topoisomerase-6 subunit B
VTRTGKKKDAHHFELVIDTQKNRPQVRRDDIVDWSRDHGTRVEIELEGNYRGGQHSVDNYIRQISLANPHAQITYVPPTAEKHGAQHVFPRVTKELPPQTAEIKPHPYGVELGVLMQMFRDTSSRNIASALKTDFSRVSSRIPRRTFRRTSSGKGSPISSSRSEHSATSRTRRRRATSKSASRRRRAPSR